MKQSEPVFLLFFLWVAAGANATSASAGENLPFTNHRIGSIEVAKSPDFDVVVDGKRKVIHFVWRDSGAVHYVASADGGQTWSLSQTAVAAGAAGGPRIAIDSAGRVHLAYGVVKEGAAHRMDGRIFHTVLASERWSPPEEALVPAPRQTKFQVCAPRIAIDGRDNVHVIGWNLVSTERWTADSRTAYARKPAGSDRFEPTLELGHARQADGAGRHGDIVTDPSGDIHIVYFSSGRDGEGLRNATTHLVRFKDGRWSPRIDVFRPVSTDMGLRAAVDSKGVLHVVGQDATKWSRSKNPNAPIPWTYYNNSEDRTDLKPVHQIDDDWEYGADLFLAPSGDVWISRGNWQKDGPFPWLGRYAHRDATSGHWTEPQTVSAEGFKNADGKYGQVPRFTAYGKQVHLFYAEQAPGQPFRFYQRTFGGRRDRTAP